MKLAALVLVSMTGCGAAATAVSAVGSLVKPKPPQITVVTNVSVPAPAAAEAPRHDGLAQAMVAGAVGGGLAAVIVRTTPEAIASGALVGAGVGYLVHTISD